MQENRLKSAVFGLRVAVGSQKNYLSTIMLYGLTILKSSLSGLHFFLHGQRKLSEENGYAC